MHGADKAAVMPQRRAVCATAIPPANNIAMNTSMRHDFEIKTLSYSLAGG